MSTRSHLKFNRLRPREIFPADSQPDLASSSGTSPIASFLRLTDFDSICFSRIVPADGEYCNSKRIQLLKEPAEDREHRPYLAIIRCGANHRLVDDGSQRNFDIALSLYACPNDKRLLDGCEYSYSGGINKYKAACQFIDGALLEKFRGFIFLDEDLEITYSHLSQFLDYCWAHGFGLAQPSLTSDSFYSHKHLLNASRSGWRPVGMVEVMCPYFSSDALRVALNTFDLSYSTWGLDSCLAEAAGRRTRRG